ncbi:MAG: universal stress protein [Desulfobacterales bacterium]|jgi:nucleotide-binding universal stress UspA family protein
MTNNMTTFANILVMNWDTHNSSAIDKAIALAQNNNAALTIVEIVDTQEDAQIGQIKPLYSCGLANLGGHQHLHGGRDFLVKLQNSGLRAKCQIMVGISYRKILEVVRENHHDLIIVGVGSPYDHMGFATSTLMNLVRKSAVPVWIVKSPSGKQGRRGILAAVDPAPGPGPFAESENSLNKQIMNIANALAVSGTRKIEVVHCWMQPMEDRLRNSTRSTEEDFRKALHQTRRLHKKWLSLLLEQTKTNNLTCKMHLLKGQPQKLVPDFARKHQIDTVIMGNVSRAGLNGLFIGNTAEKILCHSDISLLVVKPIAFLETPELRLTPSETVCAL